jgi:hypothetical protein
MPVRLKQQEVADALKVNRRFVSEAMRIEGAPDAMKYSNPGTYLRAVCKWMRKHGKGNPTPPDGGKKAEPKADTPRAAKPKRRAKSGSDTPADALASFFENLEAQRALSAELWREANEKKSGDVTLLQYAVKVSSELRQGEAMWQEMQRDYAQLILRADVEESVVALGVAYRDCIGALIDGLADPTTLLAWIEKMPEQFSQEQRCETLKNLLYDHITPKINELAASLASSPDSYAIDKRKKECKASLKQFLQTVTEELG